MFASGSTTFWRMRRAAATFRNSSSNCSAIPASSGDQRSAAQNPYFLSVLEAFANNPSSKRRRSRNVFSPFHFLELVPSRQILFKDQIPRLPNTCHCNEADTRRRCSPLAQVHASTPQIHTLALPMGQCPRQDKGELCTLHMVIKSRGHGVAKSWHTLMIPRRPRSIYT